MDKYQSNSQKSSPFFKIYCYILCIVNIFVTVLFCNGVASFYGRDVDVTYALNMVFSILSIGRSYYRNIAGTVLGIVFVVILVTTIKDVINSFKTAKYEEDQERCATYLATWVLKNIVRMIIFMVLCEFVKDYQMNSSAKLLVAIFFAVFILSRFVIYSIRGYSIIEIGICVAHSLIFVISIAVILLNVQYPIIDNILTDIRTFLNLVGKEKVERLSLIYNIVESALYFAVNFFALRALSDSSEYVTYEYHLVRDNAKKIFKLLIAFGIAVIAMYATKGVTLTKEVLFSALMPYMSVIIAGISLYLSTSFDVPESNSVEKADV